MLASGSVPSSAFLEVTQLAQRQYLHCYLTLTFCLDLLTFSDWLRQCDILGDESRPSLHDLLLQPVQRIPDYLLLLQVSSSRDLRCRFKRANQTSRSSADGACAGAAEADRGGAPRLLPAAGVHSAVEVLHSSVSPPAPAQPGAAPL